MQWRNFQFFYTNTPYSALYQGIKYLDFRNTRIHLCNALFHFLMIYTDIARSINKWIRIFSCLDFPKVPSEHHFEEKSFRGVLAKHPMANRQPILCLWSVLSSNIWQKLASNASKSRYITKIYVLCQSLCHSCNKHVVYCCNQWRVISRNLIFK